MSIETTATFEETAHPQNLTTEVIDDQVFAQIQSSMNDVVRITGHPFADIKGVEFYPDGTGSYPASSGVRIEFYW